MSHKYTPDTDTETANDDAAPEPTSALTHSRRRLTDADVAQIRQLYHVERRRISDICEAFNLPQSTVYSAARGRSYGHVPMPAEGSGRRYKISQKTVEGIRADFAAGKTQAEISRRWGVSQPYVRAVLTGRFRTATSTPGEEAEAAAPPSSP